MTTVAELRADLVAMAEGCRGADADEWRRVAALPEDVLADAYDRGAIEHGWTAQDFLDLVVPSLLSARAAELTASGPEALPADRADFDQFRQDAIATGELPGDNAVWTRVSRFSDEQIGRILCSPEYETGLTAGDCFRIAGVPWEPSRTKPGPATDSHRPFAARGRYAKTQALADVILDVVNVAFADLSLSTRQVYYQCVSRGAVPNCLASYNRVQRLVVDLRREGEIAYSRIVDRTRAKHQQQGWDSVQGIMSAVSVGYRRDLWADQSTIVMIACEKEALEGIFSEAVDQYGASLWTLRGFISESFVYDWAEEIREHTDAGKHVVVAYFGDHDPSGIALEVDVHKRLESFGVRFDWSRAGLLFDDLAAFELINIPVKHTDSRAPGYLAEYGDHAAELDALPPHELRRRIEHAITAHIDRAAWERLSTVEAAERETLDLVAGRWDAVVAAARQAPPPEATP